MQFVALFGTSVVFVAFVAAVGFLWDSQLPCGGFGWSVLCAQKIGLIRKQQTSNVCSVKLSVKYCGSSRTCSSSKCSDLTDVPLARLLGQAPQLHAKESKGGCSASSGGIPWKIQT